MEVCWDGGWWLEWICEGIDAEAKIYARDYVVLAYDI